ncbi:MAG: prephenate dehydrogenase/arogenate dehydrogenase family protein [Planctomycetes bacterium]|nr:prephenate dehydrogenase/arogenate dehydrogenase family protein [Planctomycetota bacterium]
MRNVAEWKVTIIGLGQIGASLAAAMSQTKLVRSVRGVDRHAATVKTAVDRGFIQEGETSIGPAALDADLVILAVPVREILKMIPDLAKRAREDVVFLDVGSTKVEVMKVFHQHLPPCMPNHVRYVGGHPMAGTEKAGIAAADPALFNGSLFLLTPPASVAAKTPALALEPDPFALGGYGYPVLEFLQALGARPVFMDPATHDALLAVTSHLPYLLAVLLSRFAGGVSNSPQLMSRVIGGSFRDATRVAVSPPSMTLDILATNRENLVKVLDRFIADLGQVKGLLQRGDDPALAELLEKGKKWRETLLAQHVREPSSATRMYRGAEPPSA